MKIRVLKIFEIFPPKLQALRRIFGENMKNFTVCWKWSQTCCFDMKRVLQLKKVEKSSFKNFQVTLPGFQRHFGVVVEKLKIFESSDHQDME